MNLQKSKRNRGIILNSRGWQILQEAKSESESLQNCGKRYTVEKLTELTGLDPGTIVKVLARKQGVDKRTLEIFFNAFNLELDKSHYSTNCNQYIDWGGVMSISPFYGRNEDLAILKQWILRESCQLLTLLATGGVGKTALSIRLVEQIQDSFDYVIWRSLEDTPPVEFILGNFIHSLSNHQETEADLPVSIGGRIPRLIDYLRKSRCLLILDGAESILRSGSRAGLYREGYEGYSKLFKCVGEATHQSCLILTTREKPKDLVALEGEAFAVRSLQLNGLEEEEGKKILKIKGLSGSDSELISLVKRYAGNPLALKIVASTIINVFDGHITEFLNKKIVVFGDIHELLEQQFERLSDREKEIMYWLAINREPISLTELEADIISPLSLEQLLEALDSLRQRSLIQKSEKLFTLHPLLIEYVTLRLVELVCEEICTENILLLRCHCLLKPQGKDYIGDIQIRQILSPVIDKLLTIFRSKISLENRLTKILITLQKTSPLEFGYTGGNIFNLLCQLQTDLSGRNFSNLTLWQADLRSVNLHNTNFAHADLAKSVFAQNIGDIWSVTFSPDGKLLAAGDINGEVHLYQVEDGRQLLTYKGHTGWVCSLTFSPDGRILASGSEDRTVKLWDVNTGRCLNSLQGHSGVIFSVTFSPDGRILASGSQDHTVKLWDISTGRYKTLHGHTNWVRSVAFSPNGELLASGSNDQTLKVWDTNTSQCLKTLQGHTKTIFSVAFSPDGRTLGSCGDDHTIKLWNFNLNQCLKTLRGHSSGVWSIAFSADCHTLVSSSSDQTVRLWNVSTGQCCKILQGHSNKITSVAFSPDSQTIASSSFFDQKIKLWDASSGRCLKTLQGYSNSVVSVAFSPDGYTLATVSSNNMVWLWDVSTNQYVRILQGHNNKVWSVTFSSDGRTLATCSEDYTVKLWDVSTSRCLKTLRAHTSAVLSTSFSPNNYILASGSDDHTVKLWDVCTGRCLKTLHGHTNRIFSVTFSPDGQVLASGSDDRTLRLWDVNTGQCLKILHGHTNGVLSASFTPNGHILASGSEDHTVKLWDVSTGKNLNTLHGHKSVVFCVTFSPHGHVLASGGEDHKVKLWDLTTGRCFETLQGHTNGVRSVAFNSNGSMLASGSYDEMIKLWDIGSGECLYTLKSKRPYDGMNITSVTGLTEATVTMLKALGAVEADCQINSSFAIPFVSLKSA